MVLNEYKCHFHCVSLSCDEVIELSVKQSFVNQKRDGFLWTMGLSWSWETRWRDWHGGSQLQRFPILSGKGTYIFLAAQSWANVPFSSKCFGSGHCCFLFLYKKKKQNPKNKKPKEKPPLVGWTYCTRPFDIFLAVFSISPSWFWPLSPFREVHTHAQSVAMTSPSCFFCGLFSLPDLGRNRA